MEETKIHIDNQEGETLCGLVIDDTVSCVDDPVSGCCCVACWRAVVSWNFESLFSMVQKSTDLERLTELANTLNELVFKYTYTPPVERAPNMEQWPKWYRNNLEAQGVEVPSSPPPIIGLAVDILPPLEALKFVPRGSDGGEVSVLNASTMARGLIMIGLSDPQVHAYLQKYFKTT